jgi:hypothetical protein
VHDISLASRLFSLTAASAIMLALFDTVAVLPETLPAVKVARAATASPPAAAGRTLVAVASAASAVR